MAVGRNQLLFIFLGWENFWNGIAGFDSSTFIDLSLSLAPTTSNRPVTPTVPWSENDDLLKLSLTTANSEDYDTHSNLNMMSTSCQNSLNTSYLSLSRANDSQPPFFSPPWMPPTITFNPKLKVQLRGSGNLENSPTSKKFWAFSQGAMSGDMNIGVHTYEKDLHASKIP